jgi:hypothetical protein
MEDVSFTIPSELDREVARFIGDQYGYTLFTGE